MMKALVIGATGATGLTLTQQLLEHPSFESVVVFVRGNFPLKHSKLEVHVVDFDKPELWVNLIHGDIAFSMLGTTLKQAGSKIGQWKIDYEYQYNFAKMAAEGGVSKFVLVSAIGANTKSYFFYSKMKGALEEAISLLGFKSILIFQPSLLLRPNSDRMGEKFSKVIINALNRIWLLKKYKPITVSKLAEEMIERSLTSSDGIHRILSQNI